MDLITSIPVAKAQHPISYDSRILSLGSCFATHIAQKFDHFGFGNLVNPFGILFHPGALQKFVDVAVNQVAFAESDVIFHNGRWHCFDAHSELSNTDKHALIAELDRQSAIAHEAVRSASHIIVTLGTAWVYRHIASDKAVANCHKVPQREFSKELWPPGTVSASVKSIIESIARLNPDARLIFTISPVRHLKDGFVENQRSKANLISGLHEAIDSHPDCYYFPSYEIVMDELRDYRFYASDMMHPNQIAIDYIWEKFVDAWISKNALSDMNEVDAVRKALAHKPFNPESEQHRKFVSALEKKIDSLRKRLPFLTLG